MMSAYSSLMKIILYRNLTRMQKGLLIFSLIFVKLARRQEIWLRVYNIK